MLPIIFTIRGITLCSPNVTTHVWKLCRSTDAAPQMVVWRRINRTYKEIHESPDEFEFRLKTSDLSPNIGFGFRCCADVWLT